MNLPLNNDGGPLSADQKNELLALLGLNLLIPYNGEPAEYTPADDPEPEVLGTPALAGRPATDGTDFWMACKDSPLGTAEDVWIKLTKVELEA
jgi:hypothetical protein